MNNFGYSISPSSRIDLDKRDNDKFTRIVLLESGFLKCMACGLCSSTCSGGNFTDVSLRRAIEMIQDGQGKNAVVLLKGCMLCGKCNIICPRGINTRNLIRNILKVYMEELK
ncbi:MAG TPA: 4Fe-4S dicluster domain-containing protein [Bacteroidales bacterium]|nr:4Fe-4S dicluster domain-containing protein [Bacteroidales bacterium]HRR49043.1 4Fe-4S dicluster domain-containing protein [Bacteroidales bacterium]HRT33481.1 4Fe-4S dicluster domain-containing protein [Bacteroidales bacterium]HRT83649.1 4Fe-4S dicluster domain-containing protein [Bacteroidales bacterium]